MRRIEIPLNKLQRNKPKNKTISLYPNLERKAFLHNLSPKPQKPKTITALLDSFSLYSKNNAKISTSPNKKKPLYLLTSPSSPERKKQENGSENNNQSSLEYNKEKIFYEDLILIEEKIIQIVTAIKINDDSMLINLCVEWWNCFIVSCCFNGSLANDSEVKMLIKNASSLLMFCVILCYYSGYLEDKNKSRKDSYRKSLLDLMLYHHRTFLLITHQFVNMTFIKKEDFPLVSRLKNQIKNYLVNIQNNSSNELRLYCRYLSDIIQEILSSIAEIPSSCVVSVKELKDFYSELKQKTQSVLSSFFTFQIIRNLPKHISLTTLYPNSIIDKKKSIPFLKIKNTKNYTLVLDLDETLIHYKHQTNSFTIENIQFRPGLFEFLHLIKEYYELIIFTVGTKFYADPIIDAIEEKEKFFNGRLYREHSIILREDFCKDLTNIGRDLSKLLIVDDKPFNYYMQKENGIAIKPFWGGNFEIKADKALIYLGDILVRIAKEKNADLRVSLRKYKVEIIDKVSSNFYNNRLN